MSSSYKEVTVDISVDDQGAEKLIPCPAIVHDACPGLSVTMHPFGLFAITHTPTGQKMSANYERAFTALLHMAQFGMIASSQGFSWAGADTREKVADIINEFGGNQVPFDGATTTQGGITEKMTIVEWIRCLRYGGTLYDEFPWEESGNLESAMDILSSLGGESGGRA